MTFGEWLLEQIADKKISKAELARRCGVSATYIGMLVSDLPKSKSGKTTRPSEDVVTNIAKALGVGINDARLAAGYAFVTTEPITQEVPDEHLWKNFGHWLKRNREDLHLTQAGAAEMIGIDRQ